MRRSSRQKFPKSARSVQRRCKDLSRELRGHQLGFSMSSPHILPRNEIGIIKRIGSVGGSGDAFRRCQGVGQEDQDHQWRDLAIHGDVSQPGKDRVMRHVCVGWRSVVE